MKQDQVKELLLQSLEQERGGIKVYESALQCVLNDELKEEFEKYLEQTRNHERILLNVFSKLKLDAEEASPGRTVVKLIGSALVEAMQTALKAGKPEAAELVAAECVVLAETKDHADWELIARCHEHTSGPLKQVLQDAADEVEDQEDEHLYHSKGWARAEQASAKGRWQPTAPCRTDAASCFRPARAAKLFGRDVIDF